MTEHGKTISVLCEQRGCNDVQKARHYRLYVNDGWNVHPSLDFLQWWNPYDVDRVSGASIGGHPEAYRIWARKDPGKWRRGRYGLNVIEAWNSDNYRQDYLRWLAAGKPEPDVPYVSISATLERQKEFWRGLKSLIDKIGKPMPKISHGDIALEAVATTAMPDP